jgi:exonuclease SbcC
MKNIRSIELINFQKHSSLKIDFTSGINVLVGESGVGKSCVRRAIEWCLFNTNIDGIRKEGTKQTSVKIILENEAIIERIRSTSVNRYILTQGNEEKTFDSIGKTIPEEVKDAIGLITIDVDGDELYLNSAHQIALPFLFDKSPSWRMKLFNKLTGNDLLDKLFVQFNKDILKINRDVKSDTERLTKISVSLSEKEIEKEQLEAIHKRAKKEIAVLNQKTEEYSKYLNLLGLLQNNKSTLSSLKDKKRDVVLPEDTEIEELTIKTGYLEARKTLLNAILSNDNVATSLRTKLSSIVLPALNSDEITAKIDLLAEIKTLNIRINEEMKKTEVLYDKLGENTKELEAFNNQLNDVLENLKECPTCGQEITEDCKKGLR